MIIHIKDFDQRIKEKWQDGNKRFCFVWLFYPNYEKSTHTQHDYLYGSIVNNYLLRDYARGRGATGETSGTCKDVSFAIITPSGLNEAICNLIESHFDLHVTFGKSIDAQFLRQSEETWDESERQRWRGVMNKLFVLHPDIFGHYEKVVYLDSDMFILAPSKYYKLFEDYNTPAGVYERANLLRHNRSKSHVLVKEFRWNQVIPTKFCKAGTKFYHCVNASLLVLTANETDYERLRGQLRDAKTLYREQPQLVGHVLHFPEQEYLTNFFAGRWRAVDSMLLSTITTAYQASGRFWENPDFDRNTGITAEARNFFAAPSEYDSFL